MSEYLMIRWVHVIAATAWFGEVVTINFVLIPALVRLPRPEATRFLAAVFPIVFRLASVLSAVAVLSGATLAWQRYGATPEVLWTTTYGRLFSVGATLGLLLTGFHFVLEPRLDSMICTAAAKGDLELSDKVIRLLCVVPRVGLVVIGGVLLMMMIGARGM
ncbi:MAG: DUF4149 domain-containing protein [Alphaproteobacteria bacterium]|nr:DUF4149 domain-containing protein [Alphaproteobacteria bacterium]